MCSWDTPEEDVDAFAAAIADVVASGRRADAAAADSDLHTSSLPRLARLRSPGFLAGGHGCREPSLQQETAEEAPRRRRRRRLPLVPAVLGLATVAAVAVAALSVGSDSQATTSERIVTVSQGVIQTVVSGSGNLEPANQLDVNFATSGRITKIYVEEGEHVSEGDLLARLDSASQRVALAQAQARARRRAGRADEGAGGGEHDDRHRRERGNRHGGVRGRRCDDRRGRAGDADRDATPRRRRRRRRLRRRRRRRPRRPRATATPRAERDAHRPRASPSGRSGGSGGGGSSGGRHLLRRRQRPRGGSTQSVESAAGRRRERAARAQPGPGRARRHRRCARPSPARSPRSRTRSATPSAPRAARVVGGRVEQRVHRARPALRLKLEVALSESDIGKVEGRPERDRDHQRRVGRGGRRARDARSACSPSDSSRPRHGPAAAAAPSATRSCHARPDHRGLKRGMSATADIVVSQASGLMVPEPGAARLDGHASSATASARRSASRPASSATARRRSSAG